MAAPLDGVSDAAPPRPARRLSRLKLHDLGLRAASAAVLVAAAAFALFQGGWVFAGFWLIGALAVHGEWQRLIDAPLPWLRIFVGSAALCALAFLQTMGQGELAALTLAPAVGFAVWAAGKGRRVWAGFGVFYAGGLLLSVLSLRHAPFFGVCAIGWLFAVIWGADSFAYFGGRLIGGPKLAPKISPGKTWAGFATGVLGGAALGAVVAHLWPNVQARMIPVFLLGVVAAIVAQGGDLFESHVKRRFGAKDSSHLIPGHGGFMDRLDGFIAAAVFAALFGLWRGLPSAAAGLLYWQ